MYIKKSIHSIKNIHLFTLKSDNTNEINIYYTTYILTGKQTKKQNKLFHILDLLTNLFSKD